MTQDDTYGAGDPRAAEYALGLLDAEDRLAFEAELNSQAALRADVARWQEHFAALGMELDEVAPPASVLSHLKRELWNENKLPWHKRLRIWEFALGGVAAAFVAYAVLTFGLVQEPPNLPAYQARIENADADIQLVASFSEGSNLLTVERVGAAPAPDRVYELWAIVADAAPVSLGVLPQSGRAAVALSDAQAALLRAGTLLAMSDEPAGGSPTGAPTGTVFGAGPFQVLTNL